MADILAALQQGLAGSHEIERELGRGGMARVFLARELKHDRLVALKVLDPDLARAIGSEQFLREIRLAARLQHPHILTVHDSGEVPGDGHAPSLLWFSMPYVEGESLRDRLKREGQLPIADAVRIARESADALAYAHAHGVIHRDIKPENLLLTGEHTLVADFGVARAVGDEVQHLTGTGLAIGTPAYMSPEQATAGQVDHRGDIYSLGCVLYEMVAGEPPFAGGTPAQVLSRSLSEPFRPLATLRPMAPPALERVVSTGLARAPADRYATAADMARALDLGVGPATNDVRRASERRRVNPALWAGIGLILLALAAAIVIATRHGDSVPDALDPDLIAIAPFDLVSSDEGLDVWSEGIVDVVARYFDGAGTLRAVAPTRGIRAWAGRADRESAARFGRAVGAGHVVFGQIVGGDSVRLSATLYDVASGASLDEHEWRGSAAGLDRLMDSLSTRFLDILGRTRQVGARRERPFGTSNPLAIRAFLSGMRDFRRASYASASRHFIESVRQDTAFVLGRMYGATSFGWLHSAGDTTAVRLQQEAGVRNHGLTPRDSLFVLADSISAAIYLSKAPPIQLMTRLAGVLDTLLSANPDDPEVVYRVTDENYHTNPLGRRERWHLQNLVRAIQLDSLFVPAYQHAIELSAMLDPQEDTRALVRRVLAIPGIDSERVAGMQLADLLLDSAASASVKQAALDSGTNTALRRAFVLVGPSPDTVGLMVARTGNRRFPNDARWQRSEGGQLLRRGRLREVGRRFAEARQDGVPLGPQALMVARELVIAGIWSQATYDSLNDEFNDRAGFMPVFGMPLWIASRDTHRLAHFRGQVKAQLDTSVAVTRQDLRMVLEFVDGAILLAKGDSSWFKRRGAFADEQVSLGMRAETPFGVFPIEILLALGKEDVAWQLLQSRGGGGQVSEVQWILHRARLAEKRGEREMALDDFGYVSRIWADADEPLRTYAREARDALQRLTAEP